MRKSALRILLPLLVAALLRNRFVHALLDGVPAVHPALVALFLVAGVVAGYVFLAGILPFPNAFLPFPYFANGNNTVKTAPPPGFRA